MRISRVSILTLLFTVSLSAAGASGTSESEIENLEAELARAQTERDQAFLNPKLASDSALLKTRDDAVSEKKKQLAEKVRDFNTRPKRKKPDARALSLSTLDAKDADDQSPEGFDHEKSSAPVLPLQTEIKSKPSESSPAEQTVLSGEGIQDEISYPKKGAAAPAGAKFPVPASPVADSKVSPEPKVSGTSTPGSQTEIQYPKKKSLKNSVPFD